MSERRKWFTRCVQQDHLIEIGGPVGTKSILASFKKGERVVLRRVHAAGVYPKMYEIQGREEIGFISRSILSAFLRGFEKRQMRPRPEKNSRA